MSSRPARLPFPDEAMNITIAHLCKDATCPKRNKCYRFRAVPSSKSIYFPRSPRVHRYARRGCSYFIEFERNVPVNPTKE